MQDSRLYSFLDSENNFVIHFLEGQKLIVDMVQTHNIGPLAMEYYRDTLLSSLHLLSFLKPGENIGFYIDSDEPYFRFKVELSDNGNFRTLLLPEQFEAFPSKLTGVCRITKVFPRKKPYSSLIEMKNQEPHSLINDVFHQSYQTHCNVITAKQSDQSVMIQKLPAVNVNLIENESLSLQEYTLQKQKLLNEVFAKGYNDIESIVKSFESDTFAYLGSKQVSFTCSCSKERMSHNILSLAKGDLEHIFEDKNNIEVRCDYCNKVYDISREDLNKQKLN